MSYSLHRGFGLDVEQGDSVWLASHYGIVEVNGIHLYYETFGEGPPLVVVPGLGVDTKLFSPLA